MLYVEEKLCEMFRKFEIGISMDKLIETGVIDISLFH